MSTPKLQLNKIICDTKFIGDFRGLIGQKGQKGHLFDPMFFPGRALNLACKSRAWQNRDQTMIKDVRAKIF